MLLFKVFFKKILWVSKSSFLMFVFDLHNFRYEKLEEFYPKYLYFETCLVRIRKHYSDTDLFFA